MLPVSSELLESLFTLNSVPRLWEATVIKATKRTQITRKAKSDIFVKLRNPNSICTRKMWARSVKINILREQW